MRTLLYAPVALAPLAAFAEPPAPPTAASPAVTLCAADERVLFNCELEDSRTLSLCATANVTAHTGTLQARLGRAGKAPELQHPASAAPPVYNFRLCHGVHCGPRDIHEGTAISVHFRAGGKAYAAYDVLETFAGKQVTRREAGLMVRLGKKAVSSVACRGDVPTHSLLEEGQGMEVFIPHM